MRSPRICAALLAAAALLLGACSSTSSNASATAKEKAQQLVDAAHANGVGKNVTVENAEALYGSSAPAVCKAFSHGLSSAGALIVLGNAGSRTSKVFSTDAVTYGRLVVQTYCPQYLGDYDKVVAGIKTTKSSSR